MTLFISWCLLSGFWEIRNKYKWNLFKNMKKEFGNIIVSSIPILIEKDTDQKKETIIIDWIINKLAVELLLFKTIVIAEY